jgi:Protein kinase domain
MYEFEPLAPGDPRTVGGYVLRARIGAGGMGRVFLSFTPGGRAVAVKIIRSEFGSDPEFRERFAREVSIAQQVNGIHIAQLIDAGSDDGAPWLASAYVAGPSLAQVVAAHGPLPADAVLALAGRIAESLGAIHATGMVHRDLKPGNILLDESGPKVIDFGIVRAATPTATGRSSHRTFIGSPPFMAPEQIRGQKVTAATDVFALGATLYYLCTGESAFSADFADGVLYRVIHDEPDYAACPEQVRELIRVCLRKEPAERPSTQRIVDGCRAAGAGPQTPLPQAVRAMIGERVRALAEITGPKNVRGTEGGASSAAGAGTAARAGARAGAGTAARAGAGMAGRAGAGAGVAAAGAGVEAVGAGVAAAGAGMAAAGAETVAARAETAAAGAGVAAAGVEAAVGPDVAIAGEDDDATVGETVGETGGGAARLAAGGTVGRGALDSTAGGTVGRGALDSAVGGISDPAVGAAPRDVHSMTTVTPPRASLDDSAARGRRGRTVVVAGVSSLVTAVAAVVIAALVWPHSASGAADGRPSNQPISGNSGNSGKQPSNGGASGAGTGTGAGAGADVEQWHGRVMITVNEVDLDSVPVNNGASSQVSIYDSSTGLGSSPYQFTALPYGSATLAAWTGSAAPTRTQCYDQVSSQGVNQLAVTDGAMVCVITAMDRVALLKVVDDQADSGDGILTDVTVWSQVVSTSTASAD